MSMTEAKLDALIPSVASLSEDYQATQTALDQRFRNFSRAQQDITKAEETATEHATKWIKQQSPLELKNKGRQEQFSFNSEVADHVEATAKKLQKLTPAGEREMKVIEEALEELQEGNKVIEERQKHIRIID